MSFVNACSAILDLKSWVGKPNDWQPKAMVTPYAVAVNTNLQENEGILTLVSATFINFYE